MWLRRFLFAATLVCFVSAPAPAKEIVSELFSSLKLGEISSEYVLINVWSPFCEPCGAEVSELNQLMGNSHMPSGRLTIIGLSAEGRQTETQEFITHFKPTYQQVVLDKETRQRVLQVGMVPYTMLFDQNRKVIKQWTGTVSANDILLQLSASAKKE